MKSYTGENVPRFVPLYLYEGWLDATKYFPGRIDTLQNHEHWAKMSLWSIGYFLGYLLGR